jgi:hypothetical protein
VLLLIQIRNWGGIQTGEGLGPDSLKISVTRANLLVILSWLVSETMWASSCGLAGNVLKEQ